MDLRTLAFMAAMFSLAVNSEMLGNLDANCWDGTFNYKVGTMVSNDEFVEIGLKSSFGFNWDTSGDAIVDETQTPITNPGNGPAYVFLHFLQSECVAIDGALHCQTVAQDSAGVNNKLFVGRASRQDFQIVEAQVDRVSAVFGPTSVQIAVTKVGANGESRNSTELGLRHCSWAGRYGNTFFGDARFPSSLRERIGNPQSR